MIMTIDASFCAVWCVLVLEDDQSQKVRPNKKNEATVGIGSN